MSTTFIIALLLIGSIALNEALQCYEHGPCGSNCPQLANQIKTCSANDNKCFKATWPGGVQRGCGNARCNVQVNGAAVMANVCCESSLCNGGTKLKMTTGAILVAVGLFLYVRM